MRVLLFLLICLLGNFCQGQSSLDSLRDELKNLPDDSVKAQLFLDIGFESFRMSKDSFLYYTDKGIELAKEFDYHKGVSEGYSNKGIYYSTRSDFDKATEFFQKGYDVALKFNNTEGMIAGLSNLGIVQKKIGNFFEALNYCNKSIALAEQHGNYLRKARTLNNIGSVYYELGEYQKAIESYVESLEIKKSIGDNAGYFSTNSNIGTLYFEMEEFDKAVQYYEAALNSDSSLNKMLGMGKLYQALGTAHESLGDSSLALSYFEKSLESAKAQNNKLTEANTYYYIGRLHISNNEPEKGLPFISKAEEIFFELNNKSDLLEVTNLRAEAYYLLGDYRKSKDLGAEALAISKELGLKKQLTSASWILYKTNEKLSNYKVALDYLLIHKKYNDSLTAELNKKELVTYENRVELQQLQNDNLKLNNQNELNEAELAKSQLQLQRQSLLIFGTIFVLILVSGYAYLLYRYIKNRKGTIRMMKQKNHEIEEQAILLKKQADELRATNIEVNSMNQMLEDKVRDRTTKILAQNEKLKEYAFSNAHLVRAPLARILGLVELLMNSELTEDQRQEFRSNLQSSALELDQVIRRVSDVLSEEKIKDQIA